MNTTSTSTLHDLPAGYDDATSPYFVKPEHRDPYRQADPLAGGLERWLTAERQAADHADDIAIWESNRDEMSQRDPETFRRWMKRHATEDGVPRFALLSELDGAVPRSPGQLRVLTSAQIAHATHLARLEVAVNTHTQDAVRERSRAAHRESHTCRICGTLSRDDLVRIAGRGEQQSSETVCQPCAALVETARLALAEVPAGGTRADAVASWLGVDAIVAVPTRRKFSSWL